MAKEAFMVIYDQQTASVGLDGLRKQLTKVEAEELNPGLKEACNIFGPVNQGRYVEVEAENAAQAAKLVKTVISGAGGQSVSKYVVVKKGEWKEETPN